MCAQPGNSSIRARAVSLQLDIPVELVETRLAADLGLGRAEQPADRLLQVTMLHQFSSSRYARSFRRASCNVLYNAPRVVPRRSASTSIGTPFRAIATRICRWCGVSSSAI